MKLSASFLNAASTQAALTLLERGGHRAWLVGGCVRNGLLGHEAYDIDICSDARPERVMDLAQEAGIRAIPTGLDHGTVTLVLEGRPFEVTTLRRDVETDGRHAEVAFSERLEEDAARRDFTMNALYATRTGDVIDPNGAGLSDLQARRLRFIGDAAARIEEDYLRILRFFRFHAWYADPQGGLDPEGLAACAAGVEGLAHLSRERVGAEMRKLLAAPDPAPAVAAMEQCGVLSAILPGASARFLTLLTGIEEDAAPDPLRRLAALGGEAAPERFRLSKAETKRLTALNEAMVSAAGAGELGYRLGAADAQDVLLLRGVLAERPPRASEIAEAARGGEAVLPIRAADLMPGFTGRALGAKLAELEARWIASGFTLTKDELISLAQ